ncbi:hypothetical protein [Gymnodinialimonas sp.]
MKMTITNITCNNPCSGLQDDDLFLIIQADGGVPTRYPDIGTHSMGSGDSWDLEGGLAVDFTYAVVVTAWDRDSYVFKNFDAPDYLFNINVKSIATSGSNTKLNHNGADYTFTRNISQ